MLLFEFLNTLVQCGQLQAETFDFSVSLDRPNWVPNPLCSHDASPRCCHAFVNLIYGGKWKLFWRGYDQSLIGMDWLPVNQRKSRRALRRRLLLAAAGSTTPVPPHFEEV